MAESFQVALGKLWRSQEAAPALAGSPRVQIVETVETVETGAYWSVTIA